MDGRDYEQALRALLEPDDPADVQQSAWQLFQALNNSLVESMDNPATLAASLEEERAELARAREQLAATVDRERQDLVQARNHLEAQVEGERAELARTLESERAALADERARLEQARQRYQGGTAGGMAALESERAALVDSRRVLDHGVPNLETEPVTRSLEAVATKMDGLDASVRNMGENVATGDQLAGLRNDVAALAESLKSLPSIDGMLAEFRANTKSTVDGLLEIASRSLQHAANDLGRQNASLDKRSEQVLAAARALESRSAWARERSTLPEQLASVQSKLEAVEAQLLTQAQSNETMRQTLQEVLADRESSLRTEQELREQVASLEEQCARLAEPLPSDSSGPKSNSVGEAFRHFARTTSGLRVVVRHPRWTFRDVANQLAPVLSSSVSTGGLREFILNATPGDWACLSDVGHRGNRYQRVDPVTGCERHGLRCTIVCAEVVEEGIRCLGISRASQLDA